MHRRTFLHAAAAASAIPLWPQVGAAAQDPSTWRVNGGRINGWLEELARFGSNPGGGVSRVRFSDFDVEARSWLRPLMQDSGLTVRTDPAGNIIGELPGTDPSLKPLLFGSHIDSVLNGGNYDGNVGVIGSTMRRQKAQGAKTAAP